jgi:hypothetical protein
MWWKMSRKFTIVLMYHLHEFRDHIHNCTFRSECVRNVAFHIKGTLYIPRTVPEKVLMSVSIWT